MVLIVAMMITAGFGFFANIEKVSAEKTEYNSIGTLDAFFNANSQPSTQSELYNSTYNITGWDGDINTTDTVLPPNRTNQYVFKEESTDYVSFPTSFNFADNGYVLSGHYNGTSGQASTRWTGGYLKTSLSDSDSVYMFVGSRTPSTDTPGDLYIYDGDTLVSEHYGKSVGGYGQSTHFESQGVTVTTVTNKSFSIQLNGETVASPNSANGFFITDLNSMIEDNPQWCVTANGKIAYNEDHSPMIYATESQALQKKEQCSEDEPSLIWGYRVMTLDDYSSNSRIYVQSGSVRFVGVSSSNLVVNTTTDGLTTTIDGVLKINGTIANTVSYLRYNPTTHHWVAYNDHNTPDTFSDDSQLWDSEEVGVYSDNPNPFVLQTRQYYVIPAIYFDPTRYIGIEGQAEWSNYDRNESLVNTQITVLWKGTGNIQINTGGPILYINENSGMYSIPVSPTSDIPLGQYKGLEITFIADSKIVYIRGLLDEQVNADDIPSTYDYSPSSVVYEVGLYDVNPTDESIPTVPSEIYKLIFNSANGYAYISDTYILVDPNHLLWTDIDLDLEEYFAEYSDSMRILLQGFVRYGSSITINGVDYSVNNSTISVEVTEIIQEETDTSPEVTRTYTVGFNLNGMAIDYYRGHVYLVQTNGSAKADLGEIADYIIQMDGTWFFSSSLSTINTYWGTENVWKPGWSIDMNATLLLWSAVVIGLFTVMLMRFRDMLDWEDMIILIFSVIVPMVMVVA